MDKEKKALALGDPTVTEDGAIFLPGIGAKVRVRHISEYRQNPDNPVEHSPRNFSTVLESVRKLGALRSGFSSKGEILGGNLTWEAMAEAGIEYVLEFETDGRVWTMVERPDLDAEAQQLAAYFDQAAAMRAGWSADQIVADREAGLSLDTLFFEQELNLLTQQYPSFSAAPPDLPFSDETYEATAARVPAPQPTLPLDSLRMNPYGSQAMTPSEYAELERSIKTVGVLEPLLVRPMGDGTYEVVDGMQRAKAARAVGLQRVPVTVRELDDEHARAVHIAVHAVRGRRIASLMKQSVDGMKGLLETGEAQAMTGMERTELERYSDDDSYGVIRDENGVPTRDYKPATAGMEELSGSFLLSIVMEQEDYDFVCGVLNAIGIDWALALKEVCDVWLRTQNSSQSTT